MGTIQETCYKNFQVFVSGQLNHNSSSLYEDSRRLLIRILIYLHQVYTVHYFSANSPENNYHQAPDVFRFDGILDVLTVVNAILLMNVIDPREYGKNKPKTTRERGETLHAQQCAYEIIQWLAGNFILQGTITETVDGIFYKYLAHQVKALLYALEEAEGTVWRNKVQLVEEQVGKAFSKEDVRWEFFWTALEDLNEEIVNEFSWPSSWGLFEVSRNKLNMNDRGAEEMVMKGGKRNRKDDTEIMVSKRRKT
jgi:hypothetical protein